MGIESKIICSLAFGLSAISCAAAAPQTGTWLIANGQNAYGGDIINIDAQNNKLFVIFAVGAVPNNTYFLYGRGTIDDSNVVLDLTSSKDSSVKRVTGSFNTSTTGVLNFPGVGQRSVYRVKLEDESNPVNMMGVWNFSHIPGESDTGVAQYREFNSVIPGTVEGSGIALDRTQKFGCEYKLRGEFQGHVVCIDMANPSVSAGYILKRSANELAGYYIQNDSYRGRGYGQRLVASDGETILILKQGGEAQNLMRSAMENFSYNYGSMVKNLILKEAK